MSREDIQGIGRRAVPCVKVDTYTAAYPHGCYSADNPAEGTAPAHALLVRRWGQTGLYMLRWCGCCQERLARRRWQRRCRRPIVADKRLSCGERKRGLALRCL